MKNILKKYRIKDWRSDYYYSKQKSPKLKARIRRALKKKANNEFEKDFQLVR